VYPDGPPLGTREVGVGTGACEYVSASSVESGVAYFTGVTMAGELPSLFVLGTGVLVATGALLDTDVLVGSGLLVGAGWTVVVGTRIC